MITLAEDKRLEMAAFDRLPAEWRRVIDNAPKIGRRSARVIERGLTEGTIIAVALANLQLIEMRVPERIGG